MVADRQPLPAQWLVRQRTAQPRRQPVAPGELPEKLLHTSVQVHRGVGQHGFDFGTVRPWAAKSRWFNHDAPCAAAGGQLCTPRPGVTLKSMVVKAFGGGWTATDYYGSRSCSSSNTLYRSEYSGGVVVRLRSRLSMTGQNDLSSGFGTEREVWANTRHWGPHDSRANSRG